MYSINNNSVSIHLNQSETKMELYSVVLSTTMLCLAMVFGTGGNVTILMSLCTNKLPREHHYILTVMFIIGCVILDVVWCPMEIYHLIQHYHDNNAVNQSFTIAVPSLYILIISSILAILSIICIQSLCKWSSRCISYPNILIPATIISMAAVLGLVIGYGILSVNREQDTELTDYQILNKDSYNYRIVVYTLSLWIALSLVMLTAAVICRRKKAKDVTADIASQYSEPEPMNIPTLLIKSSDDDGSDNERDDDKKPMTNSQHGVHIQGATATREDNMSTIGELPTPSKSKVSSNHLGVNMAAILGRRRHTIGQIGPTGLDLAEKSKQYGYVRKFSVDIQALQAQLENPKIHGGTISFRSDTELQKSSQNETKMDLPRRPHTPLLDTRMIGCEKSHLEERENDNDEMNEEENRKDRKKDENDIDKDKDHLCQKVQNTSHETLSPPIITLSETTGDDLDEPTGNDQFKSGTSHFRLICLLLVTFICCLIPMFITEAVRDLLSQSAYTNILTCTMALSVVQTLIYPHILFCMDNLVHVTVHSLFGRLHSRVMEVCYRHHKVPTTDEDDINVTQV